MSIFGQKPGITPPSSAKIPTRGVGVIVPQATPYSGVSVVLAGVTQPIPPNGHATTYTFRNLPEQPDGTVPTAIIVRVPGFPDYSQPVTLPAQANCNIGIGTPADVTLPPLTLRPQPVPQPSFLPFDADQGDGAVHTVLPPEQVIPRGYDIDFVRGDAWGVTLTETPPLVPGCNTTPPTMVMSYLLPWYWQNYNGGKPFVDKILTAHALRNYSHFHLDRPTWLQAGLSDTQALDLIAYVQSWGFFTSFWAMGTGMPGHTWDDVGPWATPLIQGLMRRGLAAKTLYVVGEELNSYVVYGDQGLDNIVRQIGQLAAGSGMRIPLHFTSNYPGCYGGDVSGLQQWWQKLKGLGAWGMFWQGDPNDSVGAQGAHLWDSRKYLGAADPSLKVAAFELIGEAQLYGRFDEATGRRRGWELICCTRGDDNPRGAANAPAIAGAGNGLSYPDGNPL